MLVNFLINMFTGFLSWFIDLLPQLPTLPTTIMNSVDSFFSWLQNNISLLGFFIRPFTFKTVLAAVLAILVLEEIYSYVMWVIKKIPVSSE